MITNFANQTVFLKQEEKEIMVPMLIEGFKLRTKQTSIKAPEIVRKMNAALIQKGVKIKFSEARLRKLCNYIRSNGLLPLIATSDGYYCSWDKNEIQSQINSLLERACAIENSANGLRKFLTT